MGTSGLNYDQSEIQFLLFFLCRALIKRQSPQVSGFSSSSLEYKFNVFVCNCFMAASVTMLCLTSQTTAKWAWRSPLLPSRSAASWNDSRLSSVCLCLSPCWNTHPLFVSFPRATCCFQHVLVMFLFLICCSNSCWYFNMSTEEGFSHVIFTFGVTASCLAFDC